MNYIDYTLLGVLLTGFILGYKDGIVRKIIGVAGFVIGIYLAVKLSGPASVFLTPVFNNEQYLAQIIGGLIIFLGIILLSSVLKRILHPADKVNNFINQLIGGIAGALQILIFASLFLLFLNVFEFPSEKDRKESVLYSSVYSVVPSIIDFILGKGVDANSFINDYIESAGSSDSLKSVDSTKTPAE